MRILYILYFDLEKTQFLGVQKKILNQVYALQKLGHTVDLAYCQADKLVICNNDRKQYFSIKRGLTHYRNSICKKLNYITKNNKYDVAYIRYPGSIDNSMLSTFKILKNNGVDVILEMPTYPIGGELIERLKEFLIQIRFVSLAFYSFVYLVHRICSRQIHKYIKQIVTYVPYDLIWYTPTIVIDNGVRIEDYYPIQKTLNSEKKLVLLGVANIASWHGYDRIIDGLREYYKDAYPNKYDVVFNVVGDSPLANKLKGRVKDFGLEKQVNFLGFLNGEELEHQYKNADVAIASLGMHRINVLYGSTLKTREYCAYGIPFILGYYEKTLDEDFPFALHVKPEDKPVSIKDIVVFYERVRGISNYQIKMNKFAKENFDWRAQMNLVIDGIMDKK